MQDPRGEYKWEIDVISAIISALIVAAVLLLFLWVVLPWLPHLPYIGQPEPEEIIKFYANGTALLGNGTLINMTGMQLY
jgi:hypothetical protein